LELLTNGLLLAATLFAGGYCWVLARRVRDLKSLDKGLGKSIVTLTRQIELARTTLEESRSAVKISRSDLSDLIAKADEAAKRAAEATRPAQDAERGLRYQLAQLSDRKRARAKEPEREVEPGEERSARAPGRAASRQAEPPDPAATARMRDTRIGSSRQPHRDDLDAADLSPDREPDEPAPQTVAADADPMVPVAPRRPAEPAGAPLGAPGADDEGAGRPARPSAEEVEPWQSRRTSSILQAGADLLTLKPLKPPAAKVADLPKPQPLPPLGNPLRSKSAASSIEGEDELLAALSQLAAGGKR
jgi:hypothetical protein